MAYLIQPLIVNPDSPQTLMEYSHALKLAHAWLVHHAKHAFEKSAKLESSQSWGTFTKRIELQFPDELRPLYIAPTIKSHNLIEVINQCATMERLLDALQWSIQNLSDYAVIRCHPTTSSNKTDKTALIPDNDLVLINKPGQIARFEVSDVVNKKGDSNGKENKDLASLGILRKVEKKYESTELWPDGRLFLVVSSEFSNVIRKKPSQKHYRYEEYIASESTVIVEIHPA